MPIFGVPVSLVSRAIFCICPQARKGSALHIYMEIAHAAFTLPVEAWSGTVAAIDTETLRKRLLRIQWQAYCAGLEVDLSLPLIRLWN